MEQSLRFVVLFGKVHCNDMLPRFNKHLLQDTSSLRGWLKKKSLSYVLPRKREWGNRNSIGASFKSSMLLQIPEDVSSLQYHLFISFGYSNMLILQSPFSFCDLFIVCLFDCLFLGRSLTWTKVRLIYYLHSDASHSRNSQLQFEWFFSYLLML